MLHNWANCYTSVEKNAGLISFMVGFALRRSKLVQETMQLSQLIKWKKEKKTIVTPLLAFSFTPSTVLVVPLVQFYRLPELFISAMIVHIEFFSFNSICTNLIKRALLREKGVDNSYFNRHAVEIRGGRSCSLGSIRNCVCTCFTYYDFGRWNT